MTPEPINPNIPVQIAMPVHFNHQSPIACESCPAPTTRNNVNTPTLIDSDQYHSKFIAEINSKLDFVISKVTKIDELEQQFSNMNSYIILIKQQQSAFETSLSFFSEKFDEQLRSSSRVSEQISDIERETQRLHAECSNLRETVCDLQTRSLRDNLLFTGIKETETLQMDCEKVKKVKKVKTQFRYDRIRARAQKKNPQEVRPRPIVACFSRFKDRESVRQAAPRELRGKHYGIIE